MIKKVTDRLEGLEPQNLIDELIDLIDLAEDMGEKCKNYLEKLESKQGLAAIQETWQKKINKFYDTYVA